jgi:TonB family protein
MSIHENAVWNFPRVSFILVLFCAVFLFCAVSLVAQDAPEKSPTLVPGLTVLVDGVREPIYQVGNGVKPPRLTYSQGAEYSDEARRAGISGTVVLGIVVTSKGTVTLIRVVKSRGYGLDEKAIEAVRNWKFKPATKDSKPVSVQVSVEVAFHG